MIKKILYTITLFFVMIINTEASNANLKFECLKDKIEAGTTSTCNIILEVTEGNIDSYQFNINSSLLDINYEINKEVSSNECIYVKNEDKHQINNCKFITPISTTTKIATLTLGAPTKITSTTDQIIISDIKIMSNSANIARSNTLSKKIDIQGDFFIDETSKSSLSIKCPKTTIKTNEELICDLVLNIDKTLIDYAKFNLITDDEITYQPTNLVLEQYKKEKNIIHTSATEQETSGVIGKIVVKSTKAQSKTIDINNIEIGYSKDSKIIYRKDNIKQAITIESENEKSDDNTLSSIKINDIQLENFDSNTLSYSLEIDSPTIVISAEKTHPKATIISTVGQKKLKYGLNIYKINVKSEKGTTKTYVLNITRPDKRDKDNTLKTLSVDKATIKFDSSVLSYYLTVGNDVEEVTINSTLNSPTASYLEGYGNRTVEVNEGRNVFAITIKAESGAIKTYSLTIMKYATQEEQKKDVTISDLNIKGEKFENIEGDVFEVEIEKGEKLDIDVGLQNQNATYVVEGNENLKDGSVVTIKVTSEDKSTTKEYKVNVKVSDKDKKEKEENKQGLTVSIQILGIVIIAETIIKYKLTENREKVEVEVIEEDEEE